MAAPTCSPPLTRARLARPAIPAAASSAVVRALAGLLAGLLAVVAVASLLAAAPAAAQTVVYHVDGTAGSDANAGTSWGAPFATLHAALDVAGGNDEIWIAEGVYYPDEGPGRTNDDATASFAIPGSKNGLQIYGGFANGDAFADRDPAAKPTVLSGDIDRDDRDGDGDGDGIIEHPSDLRGRNSFHVVRLDGATADITRATRIEGVIVTAGQADGSPNRGGGLFCNGTFGVCSPTVANVRFVGNTGDFGGGAYFEGTRGAASPALLDVTFTANEAENGGGGLYLDSFAATSSPTLTRVVFRGNAAFNGGGLYASAIRGGTFDLTITDAVFVGNTAGGTGGALFNDAFDRGDARPVIVNAVFAGNTAGSAGGAIRDSGPTGGTSGSVLVNVTFADNAVTDAFGRGGAVSSSGGRFGGSAVTDFTNVILTGNTAAQGPALYAENTDVRLRHTLLDGGPSQVETSSGTAVYEDAGGASVAFAASTNLNAAPAFADDGDPDGGDDTFGTADDGLRLRTGSPALDAGTNAPFEPGGVADGITTDLAGAARVQDDDGDATATANLGAYEGNTLVRYHVDARGGSDFDDGRSWGTAFQTLQKALDEAQGTDEIWIAEGVYYPDEGPGRTNDDATASFTVTGAQDGLKVYGGFRGVETTRDARDPNAYRVVLSGDIDRNDARDTDGVTARAANIVGVNAAHVLVFDGVTQGPLTHTTVLDGVLVTGGAADGTGVNRSGGGLLCRGAGAGSGCSPTLARVTFQGNRAQAGGGGLYAVGRDGGVANPTLDRVVFASNRSEGSGGGIAYDGGNGGQSRLTLSNALFVDNAAEQGGGLHGNGPSGTSTLAATNVTFADNEATGGRGGAVYLRSGAGGTSEGTFANVVFARNVGTTEGADLFLSGAGAGATLRHTLLDGGTGGIATDGPSPTYLDASGNAVAFAASTNLDADPLFVAPTDADGPDERYATPDDGLRLLTNPVTVLPSSPALDAGTDAPYAFDAPLAGVTADLLGGPRAQDDDGDGTPTIDLGAYEGGINPPVTYHVDGGGDGAGGTVGDDANDGRSWTAPFATLTQALRVADGNDQVWLAQATYRPDEGPGATPDARAASFRVTGAQDGLQIYGGFANGDTFGDRDPAAKPTVLSGDVDEDDAPFDPAADSDGNGSTRAQTDHLDDGNSYHVLDFDGTTTDVDGAVLPLTTATVLDGVTVTGGRATGSVADQNDGGGLLCRGSSFATGEGCSPTLRHVVFAGNLATFGGAVYHNGFRGESSPAYVNVVFYANTANGSAGAMYSDAGSRGESSPTLTNVLFLANAATSNGGAFYSEADRFDTSAPVLTNVAFVDNAARFGGALYNQGENGVAPLLDLTNALFSGNTASFNASAGADIYNNEGVVTLRFSRLEGGTAGVGEVNTTGGVVYEDAGGAAVAFGASTNSAGAPGFADAGDPDGPDDAFGTGDDGLRLSVGSPLRDAGLNAPFLAGGVAEDVTTDLAGTVRLRDAERDGTRIVDVGPYEVAGPTTRFYVDASAGNDGNDGRSWAAPFATLQQALAVAEGGDAVWVAEGTYYPDDGPGVTPDDRDASFRITGLQDGTEIYGGFANGDTFADRDPAAKPTVLSGDIDQDDAPFAPTADSDGDAETASQTDHHRGGNSHHVVVFDGTTANANLTSATVLDGVTVTGGRADEPSLLDGLSRRNGGGLALNGRGAGNACSPTLTALHVEGNFADGRGGGALFDGFGGIVEPRITNVLFDGNRADDSGGAIYADVGRGGLVGPRIVEGTFTRNTANIYGGAISTFAVRGFSAFDIERTTFTANATDGSGGALFFYGNEGTARVNLTDVTLAGNVAGNSGGAMHLYGPGVGSRGDAVIVDTRFTGNVAGRDGGAMFNYAPSGGRVTPVLVGVVFDGNQAGFDGGAMNNYAPRGGGDASPRVINALFVGNTAGRDGGAVDNDAADGSTDAVFINTTFAGNAAGRHGGAVSSRALDSGTARVEFTNAAFSANTSDADADSDGLGDALYSVSDAAPVLRTTLVEGGTARIANASGATTTYEDASGASATFAASTNVDAAPGFADDGDPDGPDDTFGTDDDGLRQGPGSPLLDAGLDAPFLAGGVAEDVTTDLAGAARVQDDDGDTTPTVDLGPYEGAGAAVAGIFYVAEGGTGDGASASTPLGSIQQAVTGAASGTEIVVAPGTYDESVTVATGGLTLTLGTSPAVRAPATKTRARLRGEGPVRRGGAARGMGDGAKDGSAVVVTGDVVITQPVTLSPSSVPLAVYGAFALDGPGADVLGTPTLRLGPVLTGTAGTGNDRGWRTLAFPRTAAAADVFDDLDLRGVQVPVLYRFDPFLGGDPRGDGDADGGAAGTTSQGAFVPVSDPAEVFTVGADAFWLYVFDDAAQPVAPATPLAVLAEAPFDASAAPGAGFGAKDANVTLAPSGPLDCTTFDGGGAFDNAGVMFFYLGNPYAQPFALAGVNLGTEGFQGAAQAWSGTSYEVITSALANGQGAYVECRAGAPSRPATFSGTLAFDASAGLTTGAPLVGKAAPSATPPRLDLHVRATVGGAPLTDHAATLFFTAGGAPGWDAYDLTKLAPLADAQGRALALSVAGTGPAGQPMRKALEALPRTLDRPVTVALDLRTPGIPAGTSVTLAAPRNAAWPSDWAVELEDTVTGAVVPLDAGATYTFRTGGTGQAAQVNAKGRGRVAARTAAGRMASAQTASGGGRAGARGSASAAGSRVVAGPPAPRPLDAVLAARHRASGVGASKASSGKADGDGAQAGGGGARFRLRVGPPEVLPVELTGFTATTDGADVALAWQTASETASAGFAVEQRAPGAAAWTEVGYVEGAGTTTEPQRYAFRARQVGYGQHAFRLRQVDFDGTATVAGEVAVRVELAQPYALAAYPNPVTPGAGATLDVTAREAQRATVALYDLLGRRVATLFDGPLAASATERLRLPVRGLASGVYVVRVTGERFVATRRVTVVR